MQPTRLFRNVRGSFNKYLQASIPAMTFNFGEAEFDTGNLSRWVQVDYLSRALSVKSSIIVQLSFFAKSDRFGTKAEEACDTILDALYEDSNTGNNRTIPVYDWFDAAPVKPVVGAIWVKPRQANRPVIDQYGVTSIAVTVELRQVRA